MNWRIRMAARFASVLFLGFAPAFASAQFPVPAAAGRSVSLSVGYSYVDLAMTPPTRVPLNGVDASLTGDVLPRFGLAVDAGYARASDVLSSGHHSDLLSYLGGPVFYPSRSKRLTTFLRGLAGGARETGPVPINGVGLATGYANKFAWAVGAGAEWKIYSSIGIRAGADYLHTAYFAGSAAVRGQGNIRATGSVVYYFGRHHR